MSDQPMTPGGYPTYAPRPQPERPRHGWIWAVVVLVIVLAVIGSCTWLTWAAISDTGSSSKSKSASGDAIAVIPIDGVIAGTGSSASGVITPQNFLEQLDKALHDPDVKAIVLRVDSPGGTVAASEEIATYVKQSTKPIVVTVGDVGASGAYMISSQADEIFANPGSAVGSIGVIMEIPNVAGLLDKVGVKFTVVHAGKYKDTGSPYRALTPAEKALIQGQVDESYQQFIDIVAAGRRLPRSEVASMATGWAWDGTEAKKLGLVDEIGTYQDAMKKAAKLGGIVGSYQTVTYGSSKFEDLLNSLIGLKQQLNPASALSSTGLVQPGPTLAK
jgi:protease-4